MNTEHGRDSLRSGGVLLLLSLIVYPAVGLLIWRFFPPRETSSFVYAVLVLPAVLAFLTAKRFGRRTSVAVYSAVLSASAAGGWFFFLLLLALRNEGS